MDKIKSPNPQIRLYSNRDLPQILAVIQQDLREINSKVYPPEVITFMLQRFSDAVVADIFRDFSAFFIAEEPPTGEIYGCAGWKPVDNSPNTAYLSSMFVAVSHHRQGIGRLLLTTVSQNAQQAGCTKIVCGSSLNAVGFYEREGFRAIDLRDAKEYGVVMDMEYVF